MVNINTITGLTDAQRAKLSQLMTADPTLQVMGMAEGDFYRLLEGGGKMPNQDWLQGQYYNEDTWAGYLNNLYGRGSQGLAAPYQQFLQNMYQPYLQKAQLNAGTTADMGGTPPNWTDSIGQNWNQNFATNPLYQVQGLQGTNDVRNYYNAAGNEESAYDLAMTGKRGSNLPAAIRNWLDQQYGATNSRWRATSPTTPWIDYLQSIGFK